MIAPLLSHGRQFIKSGQPFYPLETLVAPHLLQDQGLDVINYTVAPASLNMGYGRRLQVATPGYGVSSEIEEMKSVGR